MKKDFITSVTPDSGGSGKTTVTVQVPANQTESERSVNLLVAGVGIQRTVSVSQASAAVTWNYYFSVTPTSLSFAANGETKSVTVTSYRKKVVNGVETSTQENVDWTSTVSGTGFSVSGSNVTAAENSATTKRDGTVTYTQATSGKTQEVSLSQEAYIPFPSKLKFTYVSNTGMQSSGTLSIDNSLDRRVSEGSSIEVPISSSISSIKFSVDSTRKAGGLLALEFLFDGEPLFFSEESVSNCEWKVTSINSEVRVGEIGNEGSGQYSASGSFYIPWSGGHKRVYVTVEGSVPH